MSVDKAQMQSDILQFVQARCPNYQGLTPDTDLLEEGLLDSLLLVDLIVHVESLCGVQLGSEHVGPANFRSVSSIADLAQAQMRAASQA